MKNIPSSTEKIIIKNNGLSILIDNNPIPKNNIKISYYGEEIEITDNSRRLILRRTLYSYFANAAGVRYTTFLALQTDLNTYLSA